MQKLNHYDKPIIERQGEVKKMIKEYPGRSCLYIEKASTCKTLKELTKKKFLVPNTLTADQLMYLIRSRLTLTNEEALFFYINKRMLSGQTQLGDLYKKYKEKDNFLYIKYASENCFG